MKRVAWAIIKKYFKLLLSLAFIASLGFALIAGLTSGYRSVENTVKKYISDYNYPDAVISAEVTTVDNLSGLAEIEGISGADARMCADTMMKTADGTYLSARIFSYSDTERQGFYFWEKADGGDSECILLEHNFAVRNNIKAGDTVFFRIREEYRACFVSGIVSRPETLNARISESSWGVNYDFGFAYAPAGLLAKEYMEDYSRAKSEIDERKEQLENEKKSAGELLEEMEKELSDARELLDKQKEEFENAVSETESMKAALQKTYNELQDTLEELNDSRLELSAAYGMAEETKTELQSRKEQLLLAQEGFARLESAMNEARARLEPFDMLRNNGVITALYDLPRDTSIASIINGGEAFSEEDLSEFLRSRDYQGSAEEFKSYVSMLAELVSGMSPDHFAYEMTLGEILSAYEALSAELSDTIADLSGERERILEELAEAGTSREETASSIEAIELEISECDSAMEQIAETLSGLDYGIAEASTGLTQARAGLRELEEQLAAQTSQVQKEIEETRKKIDSGQEELEDSARETEKEFEDLEEELRRAHEKLDGEVPYESYCNQFLLYLEEGSDPDAVLEQAKRVLSEEVSLKGSYIYENSSVKARLDQVLSVLYTLAIFCPAVFYIVTMGITFLFMSMIIRQSRRDMGILRALGFSKGWIRGIFCIISVSVSLSAILIGSFIAYGILRYTGNYYQNFFPLPFFHYEIDWEMTALGMAAVIAVCLAATLITTGAVSKIMPKEAMSRRVHSNIKVPGWIERLTGRANPLTKYSIISILRNKGRFVFGAVCIAASIMMIFSSLSATASKDFLLKQTFEDRIHYDCQIFFEDAPNEETVEELKGLGYLSDVHVLLYYDTEFSFGSERKTGLLNALQTGTSLISIPGLDEDFEFTADNGIILERHLAERLNAQKGDTVLAGGKELQVLAISEQAANWTNYISLESAKDTGKPDYGCVICNIPEEKQQELMEYLVENDKEGYLYTIFINRYFNDNIKLYGTYDQAVWILIGFAVIVGMVIILNTALTTLEEQKHEISVLRSLGFMHSKISRNRFSQTLLQFVTAAPVGLIAGYFLARNILKTFGTVDEEYLFSSGLKEYILTLVLVFIYLAVSHMIAMRSMKKWDITENIKEKE